MQSVQAATTPQATPRGKLLRILGVSFGLAVVVGGTIGVGILRLPGTIAAQLGDFWLIIAVWALGGIYTLLGAISVAELGAMLPQAGGFYVYVRRAFGEYVGFTAGWTDWSFDPFKFLERDGYFYGRGSRDNKAGAAILIANLIRYKQEGFAPDRDLIVALTADEEGGDFNGVEWLLKNHREMIEADYCVNTDSGDGQLKNGKRFLSAVQASEKVYQSYRLEVKNPGGHSSLPVKDNAIHHLAAGVARLAKFDFPVRLTEVTRAYFERMSKIETGQVSADMKTILRTPQNMAAISRLAGSPYHNAIMRTTCVTTRLEAGHADNALPQTARAVVNCRILPGESPAEVQQTLIKVLANNKITVTPISQPGAGVASPLTPLKPEIMQPIERITAELWPGVPVVPVMETGASDSLFLRNAGIPTYCVSGLFDEMDDIRAHGKDERVGVSVFYEGLEFFYRLVKALSSGK